MSTGNILGTVAAVATFVLTGGNPGAAAIAYNIGNAAGNMLDPPKGPTIHGPRLEDKSIQTSTYGTMLPRFYGTLAVAGNITWLENNQLKETVRKKKQGGKGGGSVSTTKIYTYSATFILSLGLGPIAGVRRIWCQDKLIYNAGSDDLETIIASNQAATGFKVYLGTDDQLPDPRYEADVGVGNAPAYRGEAYIAFYDFQLGDFGNSLQGAQFKVEVVTASTTPRIAKLVEVPSGFTYGNNGNGLGPCIADVDGYLRVEYLDGDREISHHLDGQKFLVRPNPLLPNNQFPGFSANGSPVGRLNTGAFLLCKTSAFSTLYVEGDSLALSIDGVVAGMSTGISAPDRTNKKVLGIATNLSGSLILLVLTDSANSTDGACPGVSWLLDSAGDVVGSWPNPVNLSRHDIGMGRGGGPLVGGAVHCLSEDGEYLYRAEFLLNGNADRYQVRGGLQLLDSDFGFLPNPVGSGSSIAERDGIIYRVAGNWVTIYRYGGTQTIQQVPLADILEAEVERSSLLTAADLNASLLTAQARGYRVSGGSIRSALEPLQGTWPFDVIQSGYLLKAVPRGQASVMTIPWQDLGASDGDTPGDLLQESREMDSQLPARTSIKYLDAAREYAVAEQSAARDNTPAINRVDRELAIVLTADEAAGVADVLQNLPWLERSEYAFSLPPVYLPLEPSDVITVVAPWATFELRLTEINYAPNGRLECKGRPNRAALYTSAAKGGEGVPPAGTIPLPGPSLFVALDIPVVDETIQNAPGFVGAMTGYTDGYPGGVLFRSPDNGQTWQDVQGFQGKATIGYARGALAADPGYIIDRTSVLTVDFISGEPESITEDQMLNSQNIFAYGADGRWELIMAANCVLQGDGSHLLSTLVRGWKGTEWATGLHVAGDTLVLLDDPDNLVIDMAVASLGLDLDYRAVTAGASIDSAADQPFTYRGVNLEPLSVVAVTGTRDGSLNLAIDAVRRSRLSSSWWVTGVPAPVGETTEAYEIDILDGSTVKRTLTGTSFPITYTAADQTTDFGGPQASVTLNIYQMSSVVGRGYARNATL